MDYIIRKATLDDRAAIQQLITESARSLSRDDYSEQQIEGAIKTVFGVDTNLILDGTYFVADLAGTLIGCGGWSKRKTLFGGDQYATRDLSYLDPRPRLQRFARSSFIPSTRGRELRERFWQHVKAKRKRRLSIAGVDVYTARNQTLPSLRIRRR